MTHSYLKALVGAVAVLLVGPAASQASDLIRIDGLDRGSAFNHRYDDSDRAKDIQCIRAPCYPARERDRWGHWNRGGGYGRPVAARRGGWDRHDDDCRTTVKRRVNHWGELIITRTKVCS
jgi:hypothetical protein